MAVNRKSLAVLSCAVAFAMGLPSQVASAQVAQTAPTATGEMVSADREAFLAPIPLPNVEDMVVLPGGAWVIGSSMIAGGYPAALHAIDTRTRRFQKIYPDEAAPAGATATPGAGAPAGDCAQAVSASGYAGHGLAFRQTGRRVGKLYVVNHGERESIEVFDVAWSKGKAGPPTLRWTGCVLAPPKSTGNSIAVTPDGTLYATSSSAGMGGTVQIWMPGEGWRTVPQSTGGGPTGLAIAPDGKALYVSDVANAKVMEVTLGDSPSHRVTSVPFRPDNLTWATDGGLIATGFELMPFAEINKCRGSLTPECALNGYVARIDPATMKASCVLAIGPSTATVTTAVGKELWVGSSRTPRILRMRASALTRCTPR